MTHDTTGYGTTGYEETTLADDGAPPLCLVHYFTERTEAPPEKGWKPPGSGRSRGRVIERDGNLIVLEFAEPLKSAPIARRRRWQGKQSRRSVMSRVCDALLLLLLLASFLGCLAAFRY